MQYTYKCYDCEHVFDAEQSIKDRPLKKCPNCLHLSLERLIYSPMVFVSRDATTIGQLADRNAKVLGKGEVSERDAKKKEESKDALQEAKKEMRDKINKMTDSQKQRFIENG